MDKKIFTCILLMCTLVGLSSCDDYLSLRPSDKLTSDAFWRDARDADAGISAAYSQLEYSIDTWGFAEVKWPVEAYREDLVILGADATNYPNWVELSTFTYSNGNSQLLAYWDNNYTGISFCNQVLEKVPTIPEGKISETERKLNLAEAHFLRAYYHLKLLLNFEKIIIRDKYIVDQKDLEENVATREQAWSFIVNDLKAATSLPLRYDAENIGRATSGAAYSYLGFSYLTMAYEQADKKEEYLLKALEAFENVKGYALEKRFLSMFTGENKNCVESVFELQFSMSTASGANYRTQFHKWIAALELGGWDEILPSDLLVEMFKKEGKISSTGNYDTRMYETLFFKDDYYNDGTGKVFGKDYDDRFNIDKPVFRKFLPRSEEGMNQNYCAINIPLMRYANVMLMKAEVLNELGRTSEAISLINEVRKVHGDMPKMQGSTTSEVRSQIEHERMLEFPLENWRWYDLRRWGKLEEAMKENNRRNFSYEKHAFYPIPLVELNSNKSIKNKK